MKYLLALLICVGCLLALNISPLKKHKGIAMAVASAAVIVMFVFYNVRTLDLILPIYSHTNQVFYQEEFEEEGLYPDAFLPYLFKDKTVYTKNDKCESVEAAKALGYDYTYYYYHVNNCVNYLKSVGAKVICDDAYNDVVLSDSQKSKFEDLGYANDMFRNTFTLSDEVGEHSNAFHYYWFYAYHVGEMHVYVCPEMLKDSDELLVLWDDKENEDFYIVSREYYEKEVKNL